MVQKEIIEKWSQERNDTKPYCKTYMTKPTLSHSLLMKDHLSIDDRLTTNVTIKNQKSTYMSSGRIDKDDEPIINLNKISKETKI